MQKNNFENKNNFYESNRPLDLLNKTKNKKIVVYLKNKTIISGTLRALDIHLNMWLDDAQIQSDEKTEKFGKVLIRGDTIIFASPVES
ncbi:MAG: small nuclear ribonucleoprotein [Candidatus Aenigmarchaeota archaeon ex4484_52]|nr:MAG: small nuclear ribonucleoprotein [Candidatus Aenigmarchaeota archaeon ex4484_52]